jgi:hypothetical protein
MTGSHSINRFSPRTVAELLRDHDGIQLRSTLR